ncbi:hypothetical protein [Micromonospora sp. DT233]|uniref:hypothetical protein n=1 Tax=Micromonospora sp. DT233 TaxID=3393432 RepID=UPI003CF686B8
MRLDDFAPIAEYYRESDSGFGAFRQHPTVLRLRWPDDVLEQWLYEHSDYGPFLHDYVNVDLSRIKWNVEVISTTELIGMPTGLSDGDCIDEFAKNPSHWISVRQHGVHIGVSLCWEAHGTWKRWPILIDRSLLSSSATGLQVVEGRTRVGILKGRCREGSLVAKSHLAWVGRPIGRSE